MAKLSLVLLAVIVAAPHYYFVHRVHAAPPLSIGDRISLYPPSVASLQHRAESFRSGRTDTPSPMSFLEEHTLEHLENAAHYAAAAAHRSGATDRHGSALQLEIIEEITGSLPRAGAAPGKQRSRRGLVSGLLQLQQQRGKHHLRHPSQPEPEQEPAVAARPSSISGGGAGSLQSRPRAQSAPAALAATTSSRSSSRSSLASTVSSASTIYETDDEAEEDDAEAAPAGFPAVHTPIHLHQDSAPSDVATTATKVLPGGAMGVTYVAVTTARYDNPETGTSLPAGTTVVLKTPREDVRDHPGWMTSDEMLVQFERESALHYLLTKRCHQGGIAQCWEMSKGSCTMESQPETADPTDPADDQGGVSRTYLVMHYYAGGDAFDYNFNGDVNLANIMQMVTDVTKGLGCINSLGIIYSDLKDENLFVSSGTPPGTFGAPDPHSGSVFHIGDFGLALDGVQPRNTDVAYTARFARCPPNAGAGAVRPAAVAPGAGAGGSITRAHSCYGPGLVFTTKGARGTPDFIPPERRYKEPLGSFDMWGFGVLLLQQLWETDRNGQYPEGTWQHTAMAGVPDFGGRVEEENKFWEETVLGALRAERKGADEIIVWTVFQLLKLALQVDPQKRLD